MGLRDLAQRLKSQPDELDTVRLQQRFSDLATMSIAELQCRDSSRIAGEIKRMRVAPRKGIPALEIVVSDGTGDAIAVFTGRRHIAGIEHGRAVILEGVAHDEHGRRVMLNPSYTLISH
jgi:hypothetical protein